MRGVHTTIWLHTGKCSQATVPPPAIALFLTPLLLGLMPALPSLDMPQGTSTWGTEYECEFHGLREAAADSQDDARHRSAGAASWSGRRSLRTPRSLKQGFVHEQDYAKLVRELCAALRWPTSCGHEAAALHGKYRRRHVRSACLSVVPPGCKRGSPLRCSNHLSYPQTVYTISQRHITGSGGVQQASCVCDLPAGTSFLAVGRPAHAMHAMPCMHACISLTCACAYACACSTPAPQEGRYGHAVDAHNELALQLATVEQRLKLLHTKEAEFVTSVDLEHQAVAGVRDQLSGLTESLGRLLANVEKNRAFMALLNNLQVGLGGSGTCVAVRVACMRRAAYRLNQGGGATGAGRRERVGIHWRCPCMQHRQVALVARQKMHKAATTSTGRHHDPPPLMCGALVLCRRCPCPPRRPAR